MSHPYVYECENCGERRRTCVRGTECDCGCSVFYALIDASQSKGC